MALTDPTRVEYSAQRLPVPNGTLSIVTLSVGASPVGFGASAFGEGTELIALEARGGSVYVTFNGTAPSSTNGLSIAADDPVDWSLETARAAKFIQNSGAAVVYAAQFKYGS